MEKSDVKKLAPLWLKYTEDVRFDDEVRPSASMSYKHVLSPQICWNIICHDALVWECVDSVECASCSEQAWYLSGESYISNTADKPWISEMYGFSYGSAKADIWHEFLDGALAYPGNAVAGVNRAQPQPLIHFSGSLPRRTQLSSQLW